MGDIEIPPYATNGKSMSDVNNVINISPCYCQLFNQNRRSSTIYYISNYVWPTLNNALYQYGYFTNDWSSIIT